MLQKDYNTKLTDEEFLDLCVNYLEDKAPANLNDRPPMLAIWEKNPACVIYSHNQIGQLNCNIQYIPMYVFAKRYLTGSSSGGEKDIEEGNFIVVDCANSNDGLDFILLAWMPALPPMEEIISAEDIPPNPCVMGLGELTITRSHQAHMRTAPMEWDHKIYWSYGCSPFWKGKLWV